MTGRSGQSARSSSGLAAGTAPDSGGAVRPRNRRFISTQENSNNNSNNSTNRVSESGLLAAFEASSSQPRSQHHRHRADAGYRGGGSANNANIGQFLGESFTQSWYSVQELATSIFGSGSKDRRSKGSPYRSRSSNGRPAGNHEWKRGGSGRGETLKWGPEPTPTLSDVAAGSLAERDAALRAAKTASVLESHDGVNWRLDVNGRHKRRTSDEITDTEQPPDDYLVYIHHVQRNDTYAGIILRYRCREDAFRKANGLWSRDSIQTRKWLTLPVDACEIRSSPCDGPDPTNPWQIDPLATSLATSSKPKPEHDECFSSLSDVGLDSAQQPYQDGRVWSHVRWVQIDSFQAPVEVGRVSRQAMGYFPPRRKKSIQSAFSTPRQSSDYSIALPVPSEGHTTRRQSSLSGQPRPSLTPVSSHSRRGSEVSENKPAWMRGPGGVGTMGRNICAPGPEKDSLNAWANKHFPGLNIDQLPSMSVMGSEMARFGFSGDHASIVESPFEEGRLDATAINNNGTGLDRAAAAVETWLRGALAKRPTTPLLRPRAKGTTNFDIDLIELTDAGSEDGKFGHQDAAVGGLKEPLPISGSSSRSLGTETGAATLRGSGGAGVGNGKGTKTD